MMQSNANTAIACVSVGSRPLAAPLCVSLPVPAAVLELRVLDGGGAGEEEEEEEEDMDEGEGEGEGPAEDEEDTTWISPDRGGGGGDASEPLSLRMYWAACARKRSTMRMARWCAGEEEETGGSNARDATDETGRRACRRLVAIRMFRMIMREKEKTTAGNSHRQHLNCAQPAFTPD